MKHWHVYRGDYNTPCRDYYLATPHGFPTRSSANRWAKAQPFNDTPTLVKQCEADCHIVTSDHSTSGHTIAKRIQAGF